MIANKEEFETMFIQLVKLSKEFTDKFMQCENQDEMNIWAEELTEQLYGSKTEDIPADTPAEPGQGIEATCSYLEI